MFKILVYRFYIYYFYIIIYLLKALSFFLTHLILRLVRRIKKKKIKKQSVDKLKLKSITYHDYINPNSLLASWWLYNDQVVWSGNQYLEVGKIQSKECANAKELAGNKECKQGFAGGNNLNWQRNWKIQRHCWSFIGFQSKCCMIIKFSLCFCV